MNDGPFSEVVSKTEGSNEAQTVCYQIYYCDTENCLTFDYSYFNHDSAAGSKMFSIETLKIWFGAMMIIRLIKHTKLELQLITNIEAQQLASLSKLDV